jgi:hypothetical protein
MIYTDTQLNGLHTAHVNVYQSFIITAMKMHHYIMGWGTNIAKNAKFLNSRLNLIHTSLRTMLLTTNRCYQTGYQICLYRNTPQVVQQGCARQRRSLRSAGTFCVMVSIGLGVVLRLFSLSTSSGWGHMRFTPCSRRSLVLTVLRFC